MYDISIFSITIVLFLIMDSIGNISSFLSLTNDLNSKRRNFVLLREIAIVFIAMVLFSFIGNYLFELLGIATPTVLIASGVILFLIAVKILFPSKSSLRSNFPKGEPFIVPLAIPLLAGPTVLATVMLYADVVPDQITMIISIFFACMLSLLVLYVAPFLKKWLGNNGLIAMEKLTGMVLVLVAVQRAAEGIKLFLQNLKV